MTDLLDLLERLEDYMDNKSGDIDGDYGERKPNKEMTFLNDIREQIEKLENPI